MHEGNGFTDGLIRNMLFVVSTALLISGVSLFGYQTVRWFFGDAWPSMPFGSFWISSGGAYPATPWPMVNDGILWAFRQPLWAVTIVAGLVLANGRAWEARGSAGAHARHSYRPARAMSRR